MGWTSLPVIILGKLRLDESLLGGELIMDLTKGLGFREDYERACERIIHDIRQGKLGRYTLDRAEEVSGYE